MIWFLLVIFGALIGAISSVVEKKTLLKEHAMEFSAILAIFNLVFLIPFAFNAKMVVPINLWWIIILNSIVGSLAFLFFAKALRHQEVSVSSALLNFRPAFVFLLAFVFLKERLGGLQIAGIFLLILGAYVLEIKHKKESKGLLEPFKILFKSKYSHYIFISIFLYSVSSIVDKYVLKSVDPTTYMIVAHFFTALILITLTIMFHDGFRGIANGIKNSWKWIAIVAFLTVSYRFLFTFATANADVSLVSSLKQISTIFATIVGGAMFHEHNLWHKVFAVTIMVAGATLVVLG